MAYPKYVEVDGKQYEINTSFRTAIECNEIAKNKNIGDLERALAVVYKLFGDEGLNDVFNHQGLLEMARKYLSCGKDTEGNKKEKPDMDFTQDMGYIETSFLSDYGIKLENEDMHWWKFMDLMNGLSNSELGNCCVLNRIRNLRNYDVSKIKDAEERRKILESQKAVALQTEEKELTIEEKNSIDRFNKLAGL